MKANSTSLRNSGDYKSLGTPEYGDPYSGRIIHNKGWSSERVPLSAHHSRSHLSATALMPFNSGRTFPSKWDDAERWITSPVSGYGVCKALVAQPHRRPKSKSGPLEASGLTYFPNYSPASLPLCDGGGGIKNFMVASSPFTTGVLVPDGLSIQYGGGGIGAHFNNHPKADNSLAPSSSLTGCSNLLGYSSLPTCHDEKLDGIKDVETIVSPGISRQDMATQMSPQGSTNTSPSGSSSLSPSPSVPHSIESFTAHSTNMEVRDVQVDKGVSMTRQLKRYALITKKRGSPDLNDLVSAWDTTEATKNTSKIQREEAKIIAWENLQRAKAEAAIRKLEMKLEKKRTASMDKILSKLRDAQVKAQETRNLISHTNAHQGSISSHKVPSFRRYIKMVSIHSCFICHAH